ncbi:MAG: tail fiber domain-containing protein [Williamsia sp.]|nr:tail fiber domain-containing protein [Williamsia sp.]
MKPTLPFLLAAAIAMSLPAMSQSWSTTGNSGTNPPASFLGTTDAKDLVFKTNNTERGRILSAGGWRFGNASNYVSISAAGKLSFAGTGAYLVGANKYAFQYDAAPNYGLYFNAAARQYEFRNKNAAAVFSISADSGTVNVQNGYYLNGLPAFNQYNDITNTLVGNAGNPALTGYNLTATGYGALAANTTGEANTAYGGNSLVRNTIGGSNTAIGYGALASNISGNANTASGIGCLQANQTGSLNTGTGYNALSLNTTGFNNTADGQGALYRNTSGTFNTAQGLGALTYNETGSYNTALGASAGPSGADFVNTTSVGYGAVATASNSVVVGNTSVTKIGGYANWTNFSDGRYKKNITQNVPGLSFINALQPVTYTLDVPGINKAVSSSQQTAVLSVDKKSTNNNSQPATAGIDKAIDEKGKKMYTGFIAQDVEKAAQKINYDFSGVYHPQNDNDYYGLSYSDFVVPLVKAVQELSQQNNRKDSVITSLQKQIDDIRTTLSELKANLPNASAREGAPLTTTVAALGDQGMLEQNAPNPYTGATTIRYSLPQQFTNAIINITDKSGKLIKQINVSGSGQGQVTVDASSLSAGTYQYSLIVGNKVIATKQMVLSK